MVLRFTEAAADALVREAQAAGKPVRDWCAEKFKDYEFGLKLVGHGPEPVEFHLDVDGVQAPDETLSDWVVASYRPPAD